MCNEDKEQQNWSGAKHNLPVKPFPATLARRGAPRGTHFANLEVLKWADHSQTLMHSPQSRFASLSTHTPYGFCGSCYILPVWRYFGVFKVSEHFCLAHTACFSLQTPDLLWTVTSHTALHYRFAKIFTLKHGKNVSNSQQFSVFWFCIEKFSLAANNRFPQQHRTPQTE